MTYRWWHDMALPQYPAEHFPGTPPLGRWLVGKAARRAGVVVSKWMVPLEIIARYESDWNPYIVNTEDSVCPKCRGMMQCAVGMYSAAVEKELIRIPRYDDPLQAVEVAVHYILGRLQPYYGGYGSVAQLLERTGVGDVVDKWVENPDWSFNKLRPFYSGY